MSPQAPGNQVFPNGALLRQCREGRVVICNVDPDRPAILPRQVPQQARDDLHHVQINVTPGNLEMVCEAAEAWTEEGTRVQLAFPLLPTPPRVGGFGKCAEDLYEFNGVVWAATRFFRSCVARVFADNTAVSIII